MNSLLRMLPHLIESTPLMGLYVVRREKRADDRGALTRIFCADTMKRAGWQTPIAQINHTVTVRRGTIRGMHFQHPPHAEMKLVSCLRGEVWDVAVDVRKGSPTFLQWFGATLSAENQCALLIPEGFAHGFQTLQDGAEMLYCHSAAYSPQAEAGLHPLDPMLKINWPLAVSMISPRDEAHSPLTAAFEGVVS